jgi:hypothetical protein
LLIAPNAPVDQGPMLEGIYGPKGWNYRLTLPSPIETNLLLRAVVQAILTETANRSAGEHSAEVPGWLVTGLSAHLQADSEPTTLLRVQSRLNTNRIKMPAMEAVRGLLRQETPISFQELCWPGPELAAGRSNELYAACAQVFVEELLQFPDGSRRLGAMIDRLPQHLNWQTSFLEAFDGHFGQLVDVEKWWGLVCVNFTGVDFASRFSPVDSWHKLQEALDVPVQVHFSPDRLPVEAVVTLQEAIRTWGPAESEAALERAFEKLLTLRRQVTPKLRPLLDAYLEVVEGCEDGTRPVVNTGWGKRVTPPMAVLRNAACKKLNALDAQRESMRKQYVPQPAQTQLSPRDRPPGSPGADKPATPHP